MADTAPLFSSFDHAKLSLKNRLVMAPMTRSFSPDGIPGDDVVAYYQRRAAGDVGLIITEGTTVDHPVASMDTRIPFFHGEASLAGWQQVVEAVHQAGGKIAPQLWHVGTARRPGSGPNPDLTAHGPSGLIAPGKQKAHIMTDSDIADTIAAFAKSAAHAKRIGFDAVELHGAHGYLIDQFFWQGTNIRSDRFGGDDVARTTFASEIVKAVRAAVGESFPIILRYSQWKQQDYTAKLAPTPDALAAFLTPLVDAGVDIFHASTRRFWESEFEGSTLNLAGWTKKLTQLPSITVGSVGLDTEFIASFAGAEAKPTHIDELLTRLVAAEFDLVAVGRALIADPLWGTKMKDARFDDITGFSPKQLTQLI